MKPRQHFWEILGTWVKVKSPQASSLKGRARGGGGGGWGRGLSRPRSSPTSSTQALRAQSPQLRGHSSPRGISLGKLHPHYPLAKSWQAEQVPSDPQPHTHPGGRPQSQEN